MIVLGIDPGLGGALTFLDTFAHAASAIHDMPTFEIKRGKSKRRDLDGHGLHRLIETGSPIHAFVERAEARPKQSAYATGIFFQVYGEARGILISCKIPFTPIDSHVWKRNLGVPAEKDGARFRASQLMPALADCWPLKKHDGRAESALIALYGARLLGFAEKNLPPPMSGAFKERETHNETGVAPP